jgi:hypothetical protein
MGFSMHHYNILIHLMTIDNTVTRKSQLNKLSQGEPGRYRFELLVRHPVAYRENSGIFINRKKKMIYFARGLARCVRLEGVISCHRGPDRVESRMLSWLGLSALKLKCKLALAIGYYKDRMSDLTLSKTSDESTE